MTITKIYIIIINFFKFYDNKYFYYSTSINIKPLVISKGKLRMAGEALGLYLFLAELSSSSGDRLSSALSSSSSSG